MLKVSQLEVGTLATFLRLALGRNVTFPIPMDQFRNGALGQHWISSARKWQSGDRVIDVGCGYSDLPSQLAKAGCEVWGADDFGLKSGDTYWLRGKHPHDLAKQFPDVRYVFERLGDQPSSFPDDYFDVVISNQALHVAKPPHAPIWRDMLRVMKKAAGSEMLISMICNFGTDGSPDQAIDRLSGIREIERNILGRLGAGELIAIDEFETLQEKAGQSFHRFSPALYAAYVATALGAEPFVMPEELLAENFCTQVNALVDPSSVGFSNARFSNNPEEAKTFRYGRYAPLLMRFTRGEKAVADNITVSTSPFSDWFESGARMRTSGTKTDSVGADSSSFDQVQLTEDSSESPHMILTKTGFPANRSISFSILARPAGRNYLALWLRGPEESEDMVEVFFDLVSGKIIERNTYGKGVLLDSKLESIGNGWVRCTVHAVPSTSGGLARANVLLRSNAQGSSSYLGNGDSGVSLAAPLIVQ